MIHHTIQTLHATQGSIQIEPLGLSTNFNSFLTGLESNNLNVALERFTLLEQLKQSTERHHRVKIKTVDLLVV